MTEWLEEIPAAGYGALIPAALFVCTTAAAQRPPAEPLPEGPGAQLVEAACSSCHSTAVISRSAGYDTPERWQEVLSSMIKLPENEARSIAEYLAEHFSERPERRGLCWYPETQKSRYRNYGRPSSTRAAPTASAG